MNLTVQSYDHRIAHLAALRRAAVLAQLRRSRRARAEAAEENAQIKAGVLAVLASLRGKK